MGLLFGGGAGKGGRNAVYIKLDLMGNSVAKATHWTAFLAARPEFPLGDRLLDAFRAGQITRLCDCGCNTFDITVPEGTVPLTSPGASGSVFELSFQVEDSGSLEFVLFVDRRGQFSGIEVDYCANSYPVPEAPVVKEPPYHVHISPALEV